MFKKFGMIAMIAATTLISAIAVAGDVRGPREADSYVAGNSQDTYIFFFEKGRMAEVLVVGSDNTDIDCYLYDENGNLSSVDDDATSVCALKVQPLWTGQFKLVIKNTGSYSNHYVFRTN